MSYLLRDAGKPALIIFMIIDLLADDWSQRRRFCIVDYNK
jgi:hypothetical protein